MSAGDSFKIQVNDKLVDVADLKVAELKAELKKRGVSTTGNKQELVDKLKNVNNKLELKFFLFNLILLQFFFR